jgi:hypothetical protein
MHVICPNPRPKTPTCPFYPKVLRTREHTPTPSFVVFIFKFAFEYFKEFGGASIDGKLNLNIIVW